MNSRGIAALLAAAGGGLCITAAMVGKPAPTPIEIAKPKPAVVSTDITIADNDSAERVWTKSQALYVQNSNKALRDFARRASAGEWTESGPAADSWKGQSALAREQAFKQWTARVFKFAGSSPDGKDRFDPEQLAAYAVREADAGDALLVEMIKAIGQ